MNWRKLLFKLHLTHTYPTYLTGLDGSRVPANIIRTDSVSSDIRPDILLKTDGYIKPRPSMIHFDVYTSPKDPDYHLKSAKVDDKVFLANGVDPVERIDLTK